MISEIVPNIKSTIAIVKAVLFVIYLLFLAIYKCSLFRTISTKANAQRVRKRFVVRREVHRQISRRAMDEGLGIPPVLGTYMPCLHVSPNTVLCRRIC